jgi:hypothetical protein
VIFLRRNEHDEPGGADLDVLPFDIVIALAVVLCDHCMFYQRWHRSANSFSAKLKLLHPATGLNHPGLLCRWMVDCSLPFLDGRMFTPDERCGDRWRLITRSPIDVYPVSSDSFRKG